MVIKVVIPYMLKQRLSVGGDVSDTDLENTRNILSVYDIIDMMSGATIKKDDKDYWIEENTGLQRTFYID